MQDPGTSDDPARVLVAVEDTGNRQILTDWLRDADGYELVLESDDAMGGAFDCAILDHSRLFEQFERFEAYKQNQQVVLPYLLLVPEARHREIRTELQEKHPDQWAILDGFLDMPVTKDRLAERLRTFRRLRQESIDAHKRRAQLRTLRDKHTDHGVIVTETDGTIEYVNEAIERQSGYDSTQLLGNTPAMLKSGNHDEDFYQELWQTILDGEVWEGTVTNQRSDGDRYVVNQTIAPVEGHDGEVDQFVAINHEITERKELEERLRSQREQLAVLNRVLRHDIRNDMEVVLTWAELLESEVGPTGEDHLERIQRAGEHVVELTSLSRELSTLIHESESADLDAVNLDKVLSEELLKRQETLDDAEITLAETPEEPVFVEANELLSSVFRNLVNNAVQHNDTDEPQVTISVHAEEDTVRIRIADNGPGVRDELKDSIFGEGEKGLESEGTGIGLFLVDSLVESYGGSVWIEDREPDEDGTPTGAVFVVELPRTAPKSDNPREIV